MCNKLTDAQRGRLTIARRRATELGLVLGRNDLRPMPHEYTMYDVGGGSDFFNEYDRLGDVEKELDGLEEKKAVTR